MGLIPAHAGKTRMRLRSRAGRRAHPRSRGENSTVAPLTSSVMGSSPLTRGKRPRADQRALRVRLIPAHAGKTHPRRATKREARAHPRSRGENKGHAVALDGVTGSSPLTRGKLPSTPRVACSPGLIPAHAGKTSQTPAMGAKTGAHPRSRGENRPSRVSAWSANGSSPLTRGKLCDPPQPG